MKRASPLHEQSLSLNDFLRIANQGRKLIADGYRLIVVSILITTAIGIALVRNRDLEYSAEVRLLPFGGSGAQGSVDGIAGLIGGNINLSGKTQRIGVELFPEVLRSIDVGTSIASSQLHFTGSPAQATFAQYFGIRQADLTVVQDGQSSTLSTQEPRRLPEGQQRILGILAKRISVEYNKQTGIVYVRAKMPDPIAAADLANITAALLEKAIIDFDTRKQQQELKIIEESFRLSKSRFEEAESALSRYSDRNRAFSTSSAQIGLARLQRDVQVSFDIFNQNYREYEQAKMRLGRETPVLTILEAAIVPTSPQGTSSRLFILMSAIIGLGLALTVLFAKAAYLRVKAQITSSTQVMDETINEQRILPK